MAIKSLGIVPTEDAIRVRTYPITRHISIVTPRKRDPNADVFCRWMLSSGGQLVVEASGFEPLLPAERQKALAKFGRSTTVVPVAFGGH